ncbi:MAG: hypothetical protein DMD76_03660 [Candidatus Rokuibacteriota bacterium]|nr:MAG: hypothetical protein DMD76_03660 [Candidatus Rokubacteria bacterium]
MREGVKRASHGRIPEVAEMENPMESWRNRKTLILSRTDMMGLVTPAEYVSCVEQAYRMHGEGRYFMEPKGHIVLDKYPGEWEAMPSYIEEPEAAACKWVSIREQNRERFDLPTVFSMVTWRRVPWRPATRSSNGATFACGVGPSRASIVSFSPSSRNTTASEFGARRISSRSSRGPT